RADADLSDRPAVSRGAAGAVLGRAGWRLCAGEPAWRGGIWPALAPGGAAREAAERVRRPSCRRRGSGENRRVGEGEDRHFGALERRPAGRRGDAAAPRSVRCGDRRIAAGGHEDVHASVGGCVVDRRIWRPGQARRLGIHPQIFALSEREGGGAVSAGAVLPVDQGRPGASGARAQAGGA
ncbi:hypothetical protein LTR94_031791, partial [Friedmanniomyces endolithicus]